MAPRHLTCSLGLFLDNEVASSSRGGRLPPLDQSAAQPANKIWTPRRSHQRKITIEELEQREQDALDMFRNNREINGRRSSLEATEQKIAKLRQSKMEEEKAAAAAAAQARMRWLRGLSLVSSSNSKAPQIAAGNNDLHDRLRRRSSFNLNSGQSENSIPGTPMGATQEIRPVTADRGSGPRSDGGAQNAALDIAPTTEVLVVRRRTGLCMPRNRRHTIE